MSEETQCLDQYSKNVADLSKVSPNCDRSLFFRYEYDGVLVYDFNSRLSTSLTTINESEPEVKKPRIKGNLDYGIVYIDRLQYETMGSYSPQRQFVPKYTLVVPKSQVLKFDSRFESGNLHKAVKVEENEYNLILNYDTETQGYTQWFYFSVRPYKANHTVRFNIINLMKYSSLYTEGMKPLIFSKHQMQSEGIGWHRGGFNLGYYQNSYKRHYILPDTPSKLRFFYTLTFSYTFLHSNDEVFFAYSYPYTYSDLQTYLSSLQSNESLKKILRINTLCKTIAGNDCYILTITNKVDSYTGWKEECAKIGKSAAARRYMKIKETREEGKK